MLAQLFLSPADRTPFDYRYRKIARKKTSDAPATLLEAVRYFAELDYHLGWIELRRDEQSRTRRWQVEQCHLLFLGATPRGNLVCQWCAKAAELEKTATNWRKLTNPRT